MSESQSKTRRIADPTAWQVRSRGGRYWIVRSGSEPTEGSEIEATAPTIAEARRILTDLKRQDAAERSSQEPGGEWE